MSPVGVMFRVGWGSLVLDRTRFTSLHATTITSVFWREYYTILFAMCILNDDCLLRVSRKVTRNPESNAVYLPTTKVSGVGMHAVVQYACIQHVRMTLGYKNEVVYM
jgi:hypothetical protein